jgi:hypothetical protein
VIPVKTLPYSDNFSFDTAHAMGGRVANREVNDIVRANTALKGSVTPLSTSQQDFALSANRSQLENFGFKLTEGGAHISRTLMLKEITRLLGSTGAADRMEDYQRAVIENNVLGKATETTRQKTLRHLRELYALSAEVPIFAVYRDLMKIDPQSGPLLSIFIAWARDPLLRATTPAVMNATIGDRVTGGDFQQSLADAFPHQYSAKNIGKIARNAASSWTQSGHLTGRTKKIRTRVQPRAAAITFALILGHVAGLAGEQLFSSVWCRLLDLNASEARSLAEQAHRQVLITLRAIGPVVEISFPRFQQFLKGF